MTPTGNNHQGNQRLIYVINAAVEAEKKIITIKSAVQPVGGGLYHKAFMSMPRGGLSIKTAVLSSSFQSEGKNFMVAG